MKKMLVSSAVIAGIIALGGGYYLEADHQSSQSRVSETQSVVSKTKAKKDASSSTKSTKQSTAAKSSSTKASSVSATSANESQSEASATTSQSSKTATAASSQGHSNTTATSQATTGQQSASATSSSTSGQQTTNPQQLTASQINDWAWQQVAKDYQQTTANKQNFVFNQYQSGGLVYVEVYENTNADVAHLAGRFRINAQGQLEQQQLAKGNVWQVVATQP
ncbi:hypothetical protein CO218_04330 [Lactiplantibacillus plantarum]|uniref:hypothetical protein n=1 Tax=Lactiplantibacillus plantarum TaxID=1590 RepID=UPI0007BBBFE8|nr:hypothetical protein [Lactiplantibacillus plantarum]AYE58429.1 hypothetical protein CO218_04330 [Lactiplantibacillus plantarum]KZU47457.1 hypothetical protein Nizo2776_2531 [Lactiplantibacillus plantarum]QBJ56105.1 hypothetical protein C3O83_09055 [Lactiplantibacillus plantarum]RDG26941.1 hypothetical protein DQM20_08645 [Lactiplantibacillus plantarum]